MESLTSLPLYQQCDSLSGPKFLRGGSTPCSGGVTCRERMVTEAQTPNITAIIGDKFPTIFFITNDTYTVTHIKLVNIFKTAAAFLDAIQVYLPRYFCLIQHESSYCHRFHNDFYFSPFRKMVRVACVVSKKYVSLYKGLESFSFSVILYIWNLRDMPSVVGLVKPRSSCRMFHVN